MLIVLVRRRILHVEDDTPLPRGHSPCAVVHYRAMPPGGLSCIRAGTHIYRRDCEPNSVDADQVLLVGAERSPDASHTAVQLNSCQRD